MLERARAAVAERRWSAAFELFREADAASRLDPADLERVALAGVMLGKIEASSDAWGRAYAELLDSDAPRAARCAFWLGMVLINHGEMARGGGWIGRAAKALEGARTECAEQGLLMIPMALQSLNAGDPEAAYGILKDAAAIGERFRYPDLIALAGVGTGQALIALGRTEDGLATLDQAMVGVMADEVSLLVAGIAYCAVVLACNDAFDVRRAREWTIALDAWSGSQPDLVPFRGECLVHRSEILQMGGSWRDAIEEAHRARERLADPPGQPAVGMAFYQLAELHRVQGSFGDAEVAYREAHRYGHPPHPGLALLHMALGDTSAAMSSITTALQEAHDVGRRCRLLSGAVEIALAAGDLERARSASAELDRVAEGTPAQCLRAMCAFARGAVQQAGGDAGDALKTLRAAIGIWQELDVPYEAARTRVLIANACEALGDAGTADLERDAARSAFERLGATHALGALTAGPGAAPGGLTPREAEILRHVATGKTNKAIAAELVISQKTVARHLSNIFTKLDLSTRAEATAFAIKQGLA